MNIAGVIFHPEGEEKARLFIRHIVPGLPEPESKAGPLMGSSLPNGRPQPHQRADRPEPSRPKKERTEPPPPAPAMDYEGYLITLMDSRGLGKPKIQIEPTHLEGGVEGFRCKVYGRGNKLLGHASAATIKDAKQAACKPIADELESGVIPAKRKNGG